TSASFAQRTVITDGVARQLSPAEDQAFSTQLGADVTARDARRAASVPVFIAQFQLRSALQQMNRMAAFTTYVQGLPSAEQQFWQYKKILRRTAPQVVALKEAAPAGMGLTDNQIDAVWRLASTFEE